MKKIAALVFVASALVVVGCESGPSEEEVQAADSARSKATKLAKEADSAEQLATTCRQQLGGLIRSLGNTNSRLSVGLTFADYSDQVGEISVAYGRIPFGRLDLSCTMGPGVKAEKAFNTYADTYNDWNDCISDLYCDLDSINPDLQKGWSKATRQLNQARAAMADLDADAIAANELAEQQDQKAVEAETALEG